MDTKMWNKSTKTNNNFDINSKYIAFVFALNPIKPLALLPIISHLDCYELRPTLALVDDN